MRYLDELENIVEAFEKGLKEPQNLVKTIESVNEAILKMTLSDDEKKVLINACIEAASALDVDPTSSREHTINNFKDHLTEELEHLDSEENSLAP